jgi:predicted nucleic acid-binding protein
VTEAWVVNASPLILLSRIDRPDLIEQLAPAVVVPDAVIGEICAGEGKTVRHCGLEHGRTVVARADIPLTASIECWDLGSGESQVIAHCVGRERWAVLDDRAARRCAATHNVPVIGTLGIVLRAKRAGRIQRARPLVEALIAAGMFLEHEFMERVLTSVDE